MLSKSFLGHFLSVAGLLCGILVEDDRISWISKVLHEMQEQGQIQGGSYGSELSPFGGTLNSMYGESVTSCSHANMDVQCSLHLI